MITTANINWGDVPTWVGAIGTVAALFFAVLTLRSEFAKRRRTEAENRRAQASLVTAWTDRVDVEQVDDSRDAPMPRRGKHNVVVVSNQSDRVIHEVFWALWDQETEARMDRGYIRALPPLQEHTILVAGPSGGDPIVLLEFTDAEGILWGRGEKLLTATELLDDARHAASIEDVSDWRVRWPRHEVEATERAVTDEDD